jgi:hypothetical protein
MAFIYALSDPRKPDEIRYIGMAMHVKRPFQHVNNARKGKKSHVNNWIRTLLSENLEPCILRLEDCPEAFTWAQVGEREKFFIKRFSVEGHRLTNMTEGGGGVGNPAIEVRERMSRAARNRPPVSLETRARMSRAGKGRVQTEEHKRNVSLAQKGHVVTQETREKLRKAITGSKRKPPSEETRAKMSAAMKGRNLIAEHRAKLSGEAR